MYIEEKQGFLTIRKHLGEEADDVQESKSWGDRTLKSYGELLTDVKQLQGFLHYRLFDRSGSTKMDGTKALDPATAKKAKALYSELGRSLKDLEKLWPLIKEYKALTSMLGYR